VDVGKANAGLAKPIEVWRIDLPAKGPQGRVAEVICYDHDDVWSLGFEAASISRTRACE
jgi:hypothetical protein